MRFASLILMGVAFWIRVSLGREKPLGLDEAFQLFIAAQPTLLKCFSAVSDLGPQQYPLDYLISYFAARFTTNIYLLRLLPALYGALAVGLVYELGVFLRSRFYGGLWAWLLIFSTMHVNYSQTFRPYALIALLSVSSLYSFFKYWSAGQKKWLWIYIFISFLYQAIYPYAILKTLLEIVIIARSQMAFKIQAVRALSLLLLLPVFVLAHKTTAFFQDNPFSFDNHFSVGGPVLYALFKEFGQNSGSIGAFFFILFLSGLLLSSIPGERSDYFRCMGIIFWGTLAGIAASIACVNLFFNPRHAIPLLPLFLGFIAYVVVLICEKTRSHHVMGVAAALGLFLLSINPLLHSKQIDTKINDELLGVRGFLQSELKPRDVVIFGDTNFGATALYYLDSSSFFGLDGLSIVNSLNVFRFSRDTKLNIRNVSYPVYILNGLNPSLATITTEELKIAVTSEPLTGGRVWFVYLPFKYSPVNTLLDLLNNPSLEVTEKVRGVFLLQEKRNMKNAAVTQ